MLHRAGIVTDKHWQKLSIYLSCVRERLRPYRLRKNFFQGSYSGYFQEGQNNISSGRPIMMKFHFTNSETKRRTFLPKRLQQNIKFQIPQESQGRPDTF